jgi:hypothetical protein
LDALTNTLAHKEKSMQAWSNGHVASFQDVVSDGVRDFSENRVASVCRNDVGFHVYCERLTGTGATLLNALDDWLCKRKGL